MKKVSIILAVYNPQLKWFAQQLDSINMQTYENIEVLVCDDCSSDCSFETISRLVIERITKFPVQVFQNEKNLGCSKTFELLTKLSSGDYISYCDQDDIWEPHKTTLLVAAFQKDNNIVLTYGAASVIDVNGALLYSDWNKARKYGNIGKKGKEYQSLFFRTWIAGCFMMLPIEIAKAAAPLSISGTLYDHWLALYASFQGNFYFIDQTLIKYRRHSKTQTGSLAGIQTKKDYYKRIISNEIFLCEACSRLKHLDEKEEYLKNSLKWIEARKNWWKRPSVVAAAKLIKGLHFDHKVAIFELITARLPSKLFFYIVRKIQSGQI